MNHTPAKQQRPTIRLRVDRWREACNAFGLDTDTARANAFGIDRSQVTRVQNGDMQPGAVFIACVLTTLQCPFEAMFTAVK